MKVNQITDNPPKRDGILPSVKFNAKSYGIEYVGFYLLKKGDRFHLFFQHQSQNQIYEVTEINPHGKLINLVLGKGNEHCPFIGTAVGADTTNRYIWNTHKPFFEGYVSDSSADVIRIKRPKING